MGGGGGGEAYGGRLTEHLWQLENLEIRLQCVRWYCHDEVADHRHPFKHAVCTMPGRLEANHGLYTSQL